jgi:lysine biosynthesis protein LysW
MPPQLTTGCPHCGVSLNVKEAHVGRRVLCPDCGEPFEVQSVKPVAADRLGKLGRFELRAVLGQGAFGRVYRAHDPQLDREVALKVPIFA